MFLNEINAGFGSAASLTASPLTLWAEQDHPFGEIILVETAPEPA